MASWHRTAPRVDGQENQPQCPFLANGRTMSFLLCTGPRSEAGSGGGRSGLRGSRLWPSPRHGLQSTESSRLPDVSWESTNFFKKRLILSLYLLCRFLSCDSQAGLTSRIHGRTCGDRRGPGLLAH